MSDVADKSGAGVTRGKGSRRSWSRAEKHRIIEEAFHPGASVADIARNYGLNANQVFNWRRRATAGAAAKTESSPSATLLPQDKHLAPKDTMFLPICVTGQTNDEAASVAARPASREVGLAVPCRPTASRPVRDERSGLIEIDLACGTRLVVDAFVNERALRRVLSVLKVSS